MPRNWKLKDFITDGVHCPAAVIKGHLAATRSTVQAEWLLLLVFQDEPVELTKNARGRPELVTKQRFFQSLALLTHMDSSVQALADVHDIFQLSTTEPLKLSLTAGPILMHDLLAELPFSQRWKEFFQHAENQQVDVLWIHDPVDRRPSPSAGSAAKVCLLGNTLQSDRLLSDHSLLIDDLLSMINSSVPVVVHRNLGRVKAAELIMSYYEAHFEVERLVSHSASSESYKTLVNQFGQSILTAALELTGSSIGNLYLSTSDQRKLVLASQLNNDNAITSLSLDHTRSVVSFVYSTAKPLLINDLDDFARTHPRVSYQWVGSRSGDKQPYAELAVPIVQPTPGSSAPNVLGVLNVEKARPDDLGYYSDQDMTILRMLAVRFCLWRVRLASAMVNRSLARVTPAVRGDDIRAADTILADRRVPYEFLSIRSHLSEVLRQAYNLTRSKTATIRLVSIDGRSVIRFCACPDSALTHPHDAIPISRTDSVNALVARTGKPCYLSDIHPKHSQTEYPGLSATVLKSRPGVRSELCLPLIARERLIGTINLESEYADAYSGERHFLGAVAEQVRLALVFAQSQYEQSVLSVSARITLNTHELMKCADRIGVIANTADHSQQAELRDLERRLRQCTETPDKANYAKHLTEPWSPTNLRDLITEVAGTRNVLHLIKWARWSTDRQQQLNRPLADTIKLALNEVLYNSFLRASAVPAGYIFITTASVNHGGKQFTVLRISHPLPVPMDPDIVAKVYRVPIEKSDRDHIGAYLAGAIIRSVGGDMAFTVDRGGLVATTRIDIPSL